jgi:hypothetical protein
MSHPVTRSADYVPLAGWPLESFTLGSELPYTSDVLKHMMFRHVSLGLPYKELPKITARALVERWRATQIPLMKVTWIESKLTSLLDQYRAVKDYSKRKAEKYNHTYDAKLTNFILLLPNR